MEYFLAIGLTLGFSLAIIIWSSKKRKKYLNAIEYRQTLIFESIRPFMNKNLNSNTSIESQSRKHVQQHMVKIIVIEDKAYWVKDNVFYFAETDNGNIVPETVEPIDTSQMSKTDIDKMLFILDNLGKGKKDERGSTGNE